MHQPLVSVIIPCYNSEETIVYSLESLKKQKYQNIQIIIIDDGSIDKTSKVILETMKQINMPYDFIQQENLGVSVARNRGLRLAKGEYITFLDSDDVYHEKFLNTLVEMINEKQADVSGCSYYKTENIKQGWLVEGSGNNVNLVGTELLDYFMYRRFPCTFANFLYKREIIEKNNIMFDEDLKYGEDNLFVWKYLAQCSNGIVTNAKLYGYYENPRSVTHRPTWEYTDSIVAIERAQEYLFNKSHPFAVRFSEYMRLRTVFSLLKDFAKYGEIDLYRKANDFYFSKKDARKLKKIEPDKYVKLALTFYIVSKYMFYVTMKNLN